MQTIIKITAVTFFAILNINAYSQNDSLGLPGDNLDLTAVLGIFKDSKDTEEFEKKLNAADSKVNNLDLNDDGQVDYLRVIDNESEGAHSIVIRDPVSKSESQDVAVIEIEKKGNDAAHIQIVGDETLYGKNYIIEPSITKDEQPASKIKNYDDDVYTDPNNNTGSANIINVWTWPAVTYLYSPGYVIWVSPWYWQYYPSWYYPWAPYGWYPYQAYRHSHNYYGHRSKVYYNPQAHKMYYGKRVSSGYVEKTAPFYNKRGQTQPRDEKIINRQRTNKGQQNENSGKNNKRSRSEPLPGNGNQQPGMKQEKRINNNPRKQSEPNVSPKMENKQPEMKQEQRNNNGGQRQSDPNVQPQRNPAVQPGKNQEGPPRQTNPRVQPGGNNQGNPPGMNRGGGQGGGRQPGGGGGGGGRRR